MVGSYQEANYCWFPQMETLVSEADQVFFKVYHIYVKCVDVNTFETNNQLFEAFFLVLEYMKTTITDGQLVTPID